MAKVWEKAKSILTENLISDLSNFVTTVSFNNYFCKILLPLWIAQLLFVSFSPGRKKNLRELWDHVFHKIPSQPQPQLQQNWGHPNTCIARSGPIDEAGFVGQQNFGRWGRSLRRPGQPSKDLSTFQSSDDLECKRFASFLTWHFSSRK